jgi:tripartite-type tricarboxylate transporter receptor subunit TctC
MTATARYRRRGNRRTSAPDGYTIMFSTSSGAVDPRDVYRKLPFNTLRELVPVGQVVSQSNVLVAHPAVPVKTVQELVAYARARPGELNSVRAATRAPIIWPANCSAMLAKVNIVHVPSRACRRR